MITDPEYPSIVAHQVLSKIVDEFLNKNPVSNWIDSNAKVPFPELKEYLVKYQNPEEADSIMKIQKELDETKIVLHKTIETVLQRGETMEKLAADSTRLSFQTKAFAQQAKKTNSCWFVIVFLKFLPDRANYCSVSSCKVHRLESRSQVGMDLDNEIVDMD